MKNKIFFINSKSLIRFRQQIHMKYHHLLVFTFLLLVNSFQDDLRDPTYSYKHFKAQFDRKFATLSEQKMREDLFNKKYQELNRRIKQGQNLEPNMFLDMTQDQIDAYLNYRPQKIKFPFSSMPKLSAAGLFLSPNSFDWRNYGRVSPIKNQGQCGSCWAFATTAQYESLLSIGTNGIMYDLSQQYAIQCDNVSQGCNGGFPYYTNLLLTETGIPLQSKYLYQGKNDKYYRNLNQTICSDPDRIKLSKNVTGVKFYSSMTSQVLQQSLVSFGPINVGVSASVYGFQYAGASGLISCTSVYSIDHAVLLVGYNTTHWFIKNSWGTNWGNNGFGYINKTADCSIKTYITVIEVNYQIDLFSSNITITLTDTGNNGWDGVIIGLKQNGVIVGKFGQNFTNGSSYGPFYLIIDGGLQTQIVALQGGNSTNQIGFTLKFSNGTVIYNKTPNAFSTGNIFFTFCPKGNCPRPTVKLQVSMTDSQNNGWNGNVIAFKQNGTIIQLFGSQFINGSSFGPLYFNILGDIQTDIVVLQIGNQTQEVGFVIKLPDNSTVYSRAPGTNFLSSTIFKSFCPIGICNNNPVTVSITLTDSGSNGWEGSVIGFRQNGLIIAQFGSNFTNGSSFGPLNFTINGKLNTEIIATKIGNFTNQVGFVLKFANNTLIFNKSAGGLIGLNQVFTTFCAYGGCSQSTVSLLVTMTDSVGDGWNGNTLGLKQNGAVVSKFGNNFKNGSVSGPLIININGILQTQLSVLTIGLNTSSIGFTIKTLNQTIIYSQAAGFQFISSTIFTTFCLLSECISKLTNIVVTLYDSGNNGWEGNIIGLKQNGIVIGQFGQNFTTGGIYGPLNIKISSSFNTSIVVVQIKNSSTQIGFVLKFVNGTIIYNLTTNSYFNQSTVFTTFCPSAICTPPTTQIKVTLTDLWGDGWTGTVIGLRQNGVIIGTFGANFTSGTTFGPLYFNIPNIQTEVIPVGLGYFTAEIGFTLYNSNGTVIYSRTWGASISSQIIFHSFCPLGGCPPLPQSKYYITLTGTCNGWNGNILGIRQGGVIKANVTLTEGNMSYVPVQVSLQKYKLVEVVVIKLGQKTWEVGFIIRAQNGFVVLSRSYGNSFYLNSILGSFTPNNLNYFPVSEVKNREQQTRNTDQSVQMIKQIEKTSAPQKYLTLLIITIVLSGFVILLVLIIIALAIKLRRTQQRINIKEGQRMQLINSQTQKQNIPSQNQFTSNDL